MRFVRRGALVVCFLSMLGMAGSALGANVIKDGKEWMQPADFTYNLFSDFANACPADPCTGSINGIDLTGWTWATGADVNALYALYGIPSAPPNSHSDNSSWVDAIAEDFTLTLEGSNDRRMTVYIRPLPPSTATLDVLSYPAAPWPLDSRAQVTQDSQFGPFPYPYSGAFFYRLPLPLAPPKQVPTFGIYGFTPLILAIFWLSARMRSRKRT